YNAKKPEKFATWPKYEKFVADERYANIARTLGLPCATVEEGVASLVKAIRDLMKELNMPDSLADAGIVSRDEFLSRVPTLADHAYEDQCTTANCKQPRVTDLEAILIKAYDGAQ
ncbi:MAG: iron-containing alcohol dehydrogenase, partial [Eubacteriales bacterium]|nr:iron-containing alcohol dehydrogenase [Eubacteriales bacterium]